MTTLSLRQSVQHHIAMADDRLLKMIKALVESYQETGEGREISEEHKKILDQRLADHKANPTTGREWSEVMSELHAKYGV